MFQQIFQNIDLLTKKATTFVTFYSQISMKLATLRNENCHFNSQIPWYLCTIPNPHPSNLSHHASYLHKSINLSIQLFPQIFYLPKTITSIAAGSGRNRPYLSIYTHPFQTPDCEFPCMTNGPARFTYWHFRRTQNFNLEIQLFKPLSLLRVFPRFVRKMKLFFNLVAQSCIAI